MFTLAVYKKEKRVINGKIVFLANRVTVRSMCHNSNDNDNS